MRQLPAEDPAVPALRMLLGDEAGVVLDAAGQADGFAVDSVTPSQVRYSPGRSVVVQYRSKISLPDGTTAEPMLIAASGVAVPERTTQLRSDDGITVSFWKFPDDPLLPGLAAATSRRQADELLAQLGSEFRAERLRTRAYRATRRAVVEAGDDSGAVFIKVLRPQRTEALQRRHQALAPHLPIPYSLGWSKRLGIVAMQALSGETLRAALERGERQLPAPAALIELLDRFPVPDRDATPVLVAHRRAADHAKLIGAVLPEAKDRLAGLVAGLHDASSDAPIVAVHGDFHASQVLVKEGAIVGLVDVDTAGIAQRVDDLANLVGQLATLTTMSSDPRSIQAYIGLLMDEFDRRADPRILRLRIAAAIMGLATGPFRVQLDTWPEATISRLDLAGRWIESAASQEIPTSP